MQKNVTDASTGCLNCHGQHEISNNVTGFFDLAEGIGCSSCHGPSKEWVGEHQYPDWRSKTSLEKANKGLRNLRDPEVRATLCASCHIGNAQEGKVVTHAMFAAGHPPLPPIETATFSRNQPPHYREGLDVPYLQMANEPTRKRYHAEPFQMTRLALVGALVNLRETARLVAERADFDAKDPKVELVRWPELATRDEGEPAEDAARRKARWPELALATSDCYACHHDLQYPGYRQTRGYGYHLPGKERHRVFPGRVMVRMWATTLAGAAARLAGREHLASLDASLAKLAAGTTVQQFGDPAVIRQACLDLEKACDAAIRAAKAAPLDRAGASAILKDALEAFTEPGAGKPDQPVPDFEAARQLASLADVIASDLKAGKEKPPAFIAALAKLSDLVDLHPYANRQARLDLILNVIRVKNEKKEDPSSKSFAGYIQFIKSGGDYDAAKNLVENPGFLRYLEDVTSKTLNSWILEKSTADQLQRLDDEEERKLMSRLNAYDPAEFLKAARELATQSAR